MQSDIGTPFKRSLIVGVDSTVFEIFCVWRKHPVHIPLLRKLQKRRRMPVQQNILTLLQDKMVKGPQSKHLGMPVVYANTLR